MAKTYYTGPGRVKMGSLAVHSADNTDIVARRIDEAVPVVSSYHGTVKQLARDLYAEIDLTPFGDWAALPLLYPAYIGVTTTGGTGAVVCGKDPHTVSEVPVTIYTIDGRSYTFNRAAVTGHPDIHLGVDKPLFGPMKFTCLGSLAKARSEADFLMPTSNPIVESSATDNSPALDQANFIRTNWIGAWGAVTGFTAIEAEDEWTIMFNATYSSVKCQGLTRKMILTNIAIGARVRPVGPTHTELIGQLDEMAVGASYPAGTTKDLVLTGGSKTITLKNCGVAGAGFEFGSSRLGTGELMFVASQLTTTPGTVDPLLIFA